MDSLWFQTASGGMLAAAGDRFSTPPRDAKGGAALLAGMCRVRLAGRAAP